MDRVLEDVCGGEFRSFKAMLWILIRVTHEGLQIGWPVSSIFKPHRILFDDVLYMVRHPGKNNKEKQYVECSNLNTSPLCEVQSNKLSYRLNLP